MDVRLAVVVLLAFVVESSLGFGATVVTVALASQFAPIDVVLPIFVPLNVLLSAYLVVRYRRDVDRGMLFRRVLPAMLVGLPVGIFVFRRLDARALRAVFGAFVLVLSALQLAQQFRPSARGKRPLSRWVATGLLFLAGAIHGAFATGGPLAVYVSGREMADDKARFRATLSALWLVLNIVLVTVYVRAGSVRLATLQHSLVLGIALVAGTVVGEWTHRRVSVRAFTIGVYVVLVGAGLLLVVRAAMG